MQLGIGRLRVWSRLQDDDCGDAASLWKNWAENVCFSEFVFGPRSLNKKIKNKKKIVPINTVDGDIV